MNKKIKLLHIVYSLEMGGLENFVVNFLKELDRKQFEVSVCCFKRGVLEDNIKEMGIDVHYFNKRKGIDLLLFFQIANLLRRKNIDIVHTHNPCPWLYGGVGAILAGIKALVHTEHSNISVKQKKLAVAERLLSKFTSVVVGDSVKVSNYLVEKQRIKKEKVVTILNGIDVAKFKKEAGLVRKSNVLKISNDAKVIGIVGRLEAVKDHNTLINAFSEVAKNNTSLFLVIVGDGSLRKKLETKVAMKKLSQKVLFMGNCQNVHEILKVIDLFVLCSLSEGLSLALLEAVASGIPVVATRVGGNSEVIVDGETGFLVSPGNFVELAQKMACLLENRHLAKSFAEKGRIRIEERFNLVKMVKLYEEIYNRCFQKGKLENFNFIQTVS